MSSPLTILRQYWGYEIFRPQQEAIIQSVLERKDTLALLPTGGGKSICYQVPALIKEGLCLVVTPLIALMKDQVENLNKRNIPALALHSGQNFFDVKRTLENALHGNFKFLYVSPERLQSRLFNEYLPGLNLNLVAVDEAHCISQWGYDFRPPYLQIATLRETTDAPIIAVTASATPKVLDDIKEKLQLKGAAVFRQSFARPNLSYSAFHVDSKINKAIEVLTNVAGSSIVYCKSRKLTKQVAGLLNLQNLPADFYHAGLNHEERSKKQLAWVNNETRIMICTNAFGMGIDKADVRTVVHYDVPECIENYYQEAGRAGRDGKKAYAVLLHNSEDKATLKNLPELRFPPVQEIRKIYQALADYLQVPVGIGEGRYYDFDLKEFVKNFKLDVFAVMSTLKVLEQEGYISLNESVFLPAQVSFLVPKEILFDFERTHPQLEPLIKCMLRTYEGIFDNKVSVNEKQVAKLTKRSVDEIKDDLTQLHALGLIEYELQKETPQLYFHTNRAPAEHLQINTEQYRRRKEEFTFRTNTMLRYMETESVCRSTFIGNYFADTELKDCGVCDNCLKRRSLPLSEKEFAVIKQRIDNVLTNKNVAVQDVLQACRGIKKEKLWKVLEYLQGENLITIEADGNVKGAARNNV